ncbi:CPBP family intramembrane metalloprotease [Candidatus Saccharibacteria bacterium]|nr:CPBP family intramembrane metalloprotease [Candidatus Saccharibacteria bacterium]
MNNKHPKLHHILRGVLVWSVAWIFTQGIFISDILQSAPSNPNVNYMLATIWVLIVLILCVALLPAYRKKSLPKSKLLWLYLIPAILLVALPSHYALALNIWVYIPMIVITVFWQSYLTFGMLQPYLSKKLAPGTAAVITALVFLAGHLVFFLNDLLNPQVLVIGLAAFIFAFSRKYTDNIYIANAIHMIFYFI